MEALVNKIIPFSSVDGPGNRTAIFLQGCNFDCKYCHNPETIHLCGHCGTCVSVCPTGALQKQGGRVTYDITKCCLCDACLKACPNDSSPRTRSMTPEQVMEEVKKNMPFIRGITVSGGECTRWRDFLAELFALAKEEGLHTLIDSNGSYDLSADPELMAATDGVMLDVKAWDLTVHQDLCGAENSEVKANLDFLARCGKLTEVRTVVVPGLGDPEETVRRVAQCIAPWQSRGGTRYKIIRYRPLGVRERYKSIVPPTDEQLEGLAALARSFGLTDVVVT